MGIPRKIPCTVESTIDHGERVYSVNLLPERPVPPFRPGQFLHLTVDEYDPSGFWPESRVFSIASSPHDLRQIRICYSVKGRYTSRMECALKSGGRVWVKLPYGEFVIDEADDVVLIAGGTGITAFSAFLKGLTSDYPNKVYLAYGARNTHLLIYRDLVDQQAAIVPCLLPFYFVEKDGDGHVRARSEVAGRLSMDALWNHIESPMEATYYISGPPQMIKVVSHDLLERGIHGSHIRVDAWE